MAIVPTPTVPMQHAGEVAASSDLNAMATAAAFLLQGKPKTIAIGTTSQAFTGAFFITWASAVVDDDGMFTSVGGEFLTVQRVGIYAAYYTCVFTNATSWAQPFLYMQAGANNPIAASGTQIWSGTTAWNSLQSMPSGTYATIDGGGLIPVTLYPGDGIGVAVDVGAAGATGGATTPTVLTVRWAGTP